MYTNKKLEKFFYPPWGRQPVSVTHKINDEGRLSGIPVCPGIEFWDILREKRDKYSSVFI